jgi:hypothetical protein
MHRAIRRFMAPLDVDARKMFASLRLNLLHRVMSAIDAVDGSSTGT